MLFAVRLGSIGKANADVIKKSQCNNVEILFFHVATSYFDSFLR